MPAVFRLNLSFELENWLQSSIGIKLTYEHACGSLVAQKGPTRGGTQAAIEHQAWQTLETNPNRECSLWFAFFERFGNRQVSPVDRFAIPGRIPGKKQRHPGSTNLGLLFELQLRAIEPKLSSFSHIRQARQSQRPDT